MKKIVFSLLKRLELTFILAPIVFTMIFFGYMPIQKSMVFYVDNIRGEGTVSSYLSSMNQRFAYIYGGTAYFGSELHKLSLSEMKYDTKDAYLHIYNVEEADILGYDIILFNHVIKRVVKGEKSYPLTKVSAEEYISVEEPLMHVEIDDPEKGTKVLFMKAVEVPWWAWAVYFVVVFIISLLLSYIYSYFISKHKGIYSAVLSASVLMVVMLGGCYFCGSFPYIDYEDFIVNYAIVLSVSLILNAITAKGIGTIITMFIMLFWYCANYFVILFREKPIMPADIREIGAAVGVIDGYKISFTWQMIVCIVVALLYGALFVISLIRNKKDDQDMQKISLKSNLIRRGLKLMVSCAIIAALLFSPTFKNLSQSSWDSVVLESFHREGMVLTFLNNLAHSFVREPVGYSRSIVSEYLKEYQNTDDKAEITGTQPVNIIMVMNEAFSDLRTVGVNPQIDVMPYIDSLQDNTVSGTLYVSIYGGGTCNTEFEALSGSTLAFLPTGAYPYTSIVNKPTFSLASYFLNQDYVTEAYHGTSKNDYNRLRVYPYFGFQDSHFLDEFPEKSEETYLHGHPADITDYLMVEEKSDSLSGQKRFIFDVTMQNHSDYDHFEDLEEAESVKKYGASLEESARVYLSLIKASDDSLKQLVETYRNSEEPTMIIFFGDHQPGLSYSAQRGVYNSAVNNIDFFKTKFFIWTNYDTEEAQNVNVSANFLPYLIMKQGNFPMPPYVKMLGDIYEKYPIISAQGVVDSDGMLYSGVGDLPDDPYIQKYRYIQYANLCDKIDDEWFEGD